MDDLDMRLLVALKEDARRPFLTLSKDLGVSDATIHKRIHNLEKAGIIKGYTTRLDAERLGYRVTAFIELRITPGTAEAVGQKLARIPSVLEVFELHSHCDILLRVQAKDLRELRNELVSRIALIPDVVSKETNIVLNTVKSVSGPPIQRVSPARVD
jgi:Lrp/AsnC family transcriptional regulator, leucine-responsive regulatory protein